MALTLGKGIEKISDILGGAEISLNYDGTRGVDRWWVSANGIAIGRGNFLYPRSALRDAERAARRMAFIKNTEKEK